jgi:two-component system, chemotaxis family, CheB/CheR fusion protein
MPKTHSSSKPSSNTAPATPTHYVAIGASAGGLEAIEAFFTNMVPNSGLGFIVVQHLSPDYKSLMKELLSKKTQMPVHRVEEGMLVEPDNVYLIPPKKNLSIFHGKLLLSEQDHTRGINLPIDVFLHSLAEDQGERAIAVILSGTGSDGMRGVRAIKEFGGMIMAQNEESAKFDGMPRAAISTGLCDFVLPPEEMPGQLLNWVKHPYVSKADRAEMLFKEEDGLTRVFSILRERFKVDFTYYKPSTVNRRIERRMTINQVKDIKDYVAFMNSYAGEAAALFRELLIGVTSFFRDPSAYDVLGQKWLKELIQSIDAREIRFWVAGCSTGEEAYSLAILARECLAELEVSRDIKIFATDIDRDAIHFAANGTYPESIAADVSPQRLAKFFHRKDEHFQISRTIREMVVFAQHNLIKDPPFTNISLISCRNLLIYLQPTLQQKVFEFFNFSLNPNGLLFLGTSETIGDMTEFFAPSGPQMETLSVQGPDEAGRDAHATGRIRHPGSGG